MSFAAGGLGDAFGIPCPSCGSAMIRMSSGATCPECGAFVGGTGVTDDPMAAKTFRSIAASKGKAKAGVYGEWPTTIAKGTRVGFEKDGVIYVGVVASYDVDEETGEVRMTIE